MQNLADYCKSRVVQSWLSIYFNPGGAKLTLDHYSLILVGASSQRWQKENLRGLQSLYFITGQQYYSRKGSNFDLEQNNIISSHQFGFRKGRSTEDQLIVTYACCRLGCGLGIVGFF